MSGFISPSTPELVYDFTRCRRADGSFYGTSGNCRKGVEVGAKGKEFSVGVTWGKFNIPTPGHAKVIKKLLEKSSEVQVIMSGAKTNVDWNLRTLMFRRLLKKRGGRRFASQIYSFPQHVWFLERDCSNQRTWKSCFGPGRGPEELSGRIEQEIWN